MSQEKKVFGYKAFYKNLKNSYGFSFQIGKHYHIDGEIKFGTTGNGFHFCKNIEDTFRYVGGLEEEFEVCQVLGSGTIVEFQDEYYGYYNMYACSDLVILRKLSREEILHLAYRMTPTSLERFFQGFMLTPEEIVYFQENIDLQRQDLQKTLAYYQLGDRNAYRR